LQAARCSPFSARCFHPFDLFCRGLSPPNTFTTLHLERKRRRSTIHQNIIDASSSI
ncbi:hypothetical protein M378DRAFT_171703, partial [Amanita muscaria Koide BX008]